MVSEGAVCLHSWMLCLRWAEFYMNKPRLYHTFLSMEMLRTRSYRSSTLCFLPAGSSGDMALYNRHSTHSFPFLWKRHDFSGCDSAHMSFQFLESWDRKIKNSRQTCKTLSQNNKNIIVEAMNSKWISRRHTHTMGAKRMEKISLAKCTWPTDDMN